MKVNRYHKLWDRPSSNLSPSLISRKLRLGRRQGSAIAIFPGTCPLFPAISKAWFDLKRTANSKERSILSEFFSHLCIFPYLRISNSINYLLTRLRHKVKETFSFLDILFADHPVCAIPTGDSHGFLSLTAIFWTPICLDKPFSEIKLQHEKCCLDLLKNFLLNALRQKLLVETNICNCCNQILESVLRYLPDVSL